jgi:ubiquitin-like 1-activating enzyme E1 B
MAGNIIPAIASTNAIVSGLEVIEMLKCLRGKRDKMRGYFVQNQNSKIMAVRLEQPLPECAVCGPGAMPVVVECDFNAFTLRQLVDYIGQASPALQEYSINIGSKEIYNSE